MATLNSTAILGNDNYKEVIPYSLALEIGQILAQFDTETFSLNSPYTMQARKGKRYNLKNRVKFR